MRLRGKVSREREQQSHRRDAENAEGFLFSFGAERAPKEKASSPKPDSSVLHKKDSQRMQTRRAENPRGIEEKELQ